MSAKLKVVGHRGEIVETSNTILLPLPQNSDVANNTDDMTKHEAELFELREIVHNLAASVAVNAAKATPTNGEKGKQSWFMASIAVITILGAAGNFLGSSGMWVGKREQQSEQLIERVKELRDEVGYLKTWNEKLRNQMSAYGWLIDNEGNVSRIEQTQPKRR